MNDIVERLRVGDYGPTYGPSCIELEAASEIERLRSLLKEAGEALDWYGEQTRLCRLIHSGGDAGRNALADDGGSIARTVLSKIKGEE